ncbi:MAG: alpha/beta hydrolase [Betaproteobacteria bacterium]
MSSAPVYTAEFVERGYNNRAAVPEHPAWLARYATMSEAARAALSPRQDVRYGPNPNETLDLFLPSGTPRGTFAFFHGGYWRALDKRDFSFVAPPLVAQGIAVAVVNYDLCPAVTVSAIADECCRAVRWLARDGVAHGLGHGRLVAGGHSAGGHLVAMLHATDWSAHGFAANPLAGGVTLSGVHDLAPLVLATMNADLGLDAAEADRMSPVHMVPTTAAPLVMAVGGDETSEFIRQTKILWDAWPGCRSPGDAGPLVIPGRHHFSVVVDHADPRSDLTRRTLALF